VQAGLEEQAPVEEPLHPADAETDRHAVAHQRWSDTGESLGLSN